MELRQREKLMTSA